MEEKFWQDIYLFYLAAFWPDWLLFGADTAPESCYMSFLCVSMFARVKKGSPTNTQAISANISGPRGGQLPMKVRYTCAPPVYW